MIVINIGGAANLVGCLKPEAGNDRLSAVMAGTSCAREIDVWLILVPAEATGRL
jgi:hypothetical protein